MKYFLAVAQIENVNRAAEQIHVSPAALSKAIHRLEEELQTPLFFKVGRGIKLTPEGKTLKQKIAHLVQLEEDIRLELMGKEIGSLNVYISSEEILQTSYGVLLIQKIQTLYPQAKMQFLIRSENKALEQVDQGEAHLAIITQESPSDLHTKVISKVEFVTCASKQHPLFKKYKPSQTIPIEEILKHNFVAPDSAILGKITKSASIDGWRDDKFPRQIKYKVCGLKLMENLIQSGLALGYLPDYFVKSAGLIPLKISGCPYTCHQTIRLVAKDPKSLGWLNRVWDLF